MNLKGSHLTLNENADWGGIRPDPRFFQTLSPRKASELAKFCGGHLAELAADVVVDTVGALETASSSALSFCEDARKLAASLEKTHAGAVFLKEGSALPAGTRFSAIFVKEPKAAFAKASPMLVQERKLAAGPLIHPGAVIGSDVVIEPGAVLAEGVRVGDHARIGANAVLHCGVAIGRNTQIGAGASIQCALVGDRVVIGPNATIGHPGFGLVNIDGESQDMPQYGRAVIQDGVSIGAGACIDRGAFADTIVGEGSKVDNLVHIGHNVVVGRNVVIIACTGISGSVIIGDGAVLAGAVGVADHVKIGSKAVLMARSGVICDIPSGEVWGGAPARPRRQWLRETAWLAKAARSRPEE